MSEVINLMEMGGLMRRAIHMIRGIQVTQSEANLHLAVFSAIPWFKVCPWRPSGTRCSVAAHLVRLSQQDKVVYKT